MDEKNSSEIEPIGVRRDLLILIFATSVLFFTALGERDLWNPNEPTYGLAVSEMASRSDWLVPTVNGLVFAEKPILYYWAARLSSIAFGRIDELTLRVPSAIAAIASALLTYLLVLPYAGRRRALIAAALLVTQYQVFWNGRSIQMDILVMVFTLAVLVPLTRMLDFGMAPHRAWMLAGLAAGLGFAAKGPVALIVPGLAFTAYAFPRLGFSWLRSRGFLVGIAVAVAVGCPWFLMLAWRGETGVLEEVLIRQNFGRFVSAWDHQRPWWYYFPYLWTDFAPWSWLLPAALFLKSQDATEGKLRRLGWIWIATTLLFFSLSDSKRSPYMLPIAPAIAFLAANVVDHLAARRAGSMPRRAALTAMAALGLLFAVAGLVSISHYPIDDPAAGTAARFLAVSFVTFGILIIASTIISRRFPPLPPALLFTGSVAIYLVASVWVLPAFNSLKSARPMAKTVVEYSNGNRGEVASYKLWRWRAEYAFYAQRIIPNLSSPSSLSAFWLRSSAPLVIVEEAGLREAQATLRGERIIAQRKIGGRKAFVLAKTERYQ